MNLFERIKNIRKNNLQEKMKFPGGTGDIGFTAPKRGEKVQKRLDRADKLGTPDPFDPDYDKKVKKVDGRTKTGKVFKSTKPVSTSATGFGKGDTPGQIRVKGLEKKAFKKTKPSDIKLPKSFTDFQRNLQDYKDRNLPGGPRKSSTKSKTSGTSQTRQDVGMAPPDEPKTKGVKQSEVSKKQKDFTKQINQNKNKKSFEKFKKQADAASDKLVGQRQVVRSAPGEKDVQQLRNINKKIKATERISKGYDLASKGKGNLKSPVLVASDLKQVTDTTSKVKTSTKVRAKKVPNTFKTFPTAGGNKVTQSTRSLTNKNKGSIKFKPPSKGVSSPPLSPKGKKFVSRIPKVLKKSKTLTNIAKAAVKNPYVAGAVGVGLAAAGAYAGYKALKNRENNKKPLSYKDFKSLSTPSDPDKGKIIHTRDIPKMNIKKGDVAKFPSPNKIPKSTSAEFKSNYAYK